MKSDSARIAKLLTTEGFAPNWFADIEYINWAGETKNLNFVNGASSEEILLVDDCEKYVIRDKRGNWIKAPYFDYPYSDDDQGLREISQLHYASRVLLLIVSERPPLTERIGSYRQAVSFTALRAAGHQRTMIETPPRPKTRNTTQLQRLLALGGSITPTRSRKARGISTVPGTPGNSIVISRW